MAREDRTADAEVLEPEREVIGLGRDRNVALASFDDGSAVAHHLPRQTAGAGKTRDDLAPQERARRHAVNEHQWQALAPLDPPHRNIDLSDRDALDRGAFRIHAHALPDRWQRLPE
jgi:hypothetical protein